MTKNETTNRLEIIDVPVNESLAVAGSRACAHWQNSLNGGMNPRQISAKSKVSYVWHCEEGHTYHATPYSRVFRGKNCPECAIRADAEYLIARREGIREPLGNGLVGCYSLDTSATTNKKYQVRHDGSAIDQVCITLLDEFDLPESTNFSLGGLSRPIRVSKGRQQKPDFIIEGAVLKRQYQITVLVDSKKLQELDIESLADKYNSHRHSITFAPNNCMRLRFEMYLAVSVLDAVLHCHPAKKYLARFSADLEGLTKVLALKKLNINDLIALYFDPSFCADFAKAVDDVYRKDNQILERGVGSKSQLRLAHLLNQRGYLTTLEYSPKYLGRQRYDIFLPASGVAVEYHGLQHYQPVEMFGGDERFATTESWDEHKLRLSLKNDVGLIVWPHFYAIDAKNLNVFEELVVLISDSKAIASLWVVSA